MIQRQYLMPIHITIFFLLIVLSSVSLNSYALMNSWSKRADTPFTPRQWASTVVLNGKIYFIGGFIGGSTPLVDEYDPSTDTWTRKADMPMARDSLATLVIDGKIYVFGGWVEGSNAGGGYAYPLSQIDVYDPITDMWTTKGNMPSLRGCQAVAMVNGKVYNIGGWGVGGQALSTVEEYDPVTDIWTKKTDMPTARYLCYNITPVVNGKIYIIGGLEGNYNTAYPFSIVEEYDPATDTWTRKTDIPTARMDFGISEVNGRIYIIGGRDNTRSRSNVVEEYNPVTDTWVRKADMLNDRDNFSASAMDGYIYAIGASNSIEVYDTGLGMEIKSISPQETLTTGGASLVISGSEFLPQLMVTIGDKPLLDQKVTNNLITGVLPPNTEGEKDIVITVPEFNYTSIAGKIFYNPVSNIVVTKISQDKGKQAGGDFVSIAGSGFLPGATVTVGGNLGTNVGVTPTIITFRIPPGTEGAKDVVITNPDGQRGILRKGYTYNPFPVIDSIDSGFGGPLGGGTEISIIGQNFIQGVAVFIGNGRVTKVEFISSNELRLNTPPGTKGMKPIKVVNPDGQEAVFAEGFEYNEPPSIHRIEPNTGALEGGTWVTIEGVDLDVIGATVGGMYAKVIYENSSTESITIVTPPLSAGVKDIEVVNYDGQKDIYEDAFTYTPAPTITGITPNNGKLSGGVKITIQGNGFMPEARVFIGMLGQDTVTNIAIWSWEYVSPTMMTALLPSSKESKIVSIVVVNPDDQKAILKDGFTYNSIPTITSIQPDNGPSSGGTTLVIKGSGFLPGAKVQVGYSLVPAIVKDDSTIETITPSGQPGKFSVGVINPDTQSVFRSDSFIYIGKMAYNYPNPFRASQGTTFRYVSKDKVSSIEVRIFNTGGVPIDIVQADGTNEVKWRNPSLQTGIYIYLMEVVLDDGKKENHKGVLEVSR